MAVLNYAQDYQQILANAFPDVLNFGELYGNTQGYRFIDAKTIQIPTLTTTGRVNADRDTIGTISRNFDNGWETKTLTNQRKWDTLVHPMDIDQTNMAASIANITRTFNEFQKFNEMDCYLSSKVYADWTAQSMTAATTVLTTANILEEFDKLMLAMDNAQIPSNGRVLYCTHEVKTMLKQATGISRSFDVQSTIDSINRDVSRLDEVTVKAVPATVMKTSYVFTTGAVPATGAKQIYMMLIHPSVIITPISYSFSQLSEPSAMSQGKWVYYEESFEDVFILNNRKDGIQFIVEGEEEEAQGEETP